MADNTKFTISNLDASDKLVALYTNIKADRKLDKDDVFGYYKLSSIGKASNQEIEIFQLFKDRPVETATVGWVGVGNMSYNVFVPYYPMLIDSMYSGYQVSTASAKFTTEKPDTFCTYGTSWAQDAEGNWQRVSGFKAYPSNWKDSYYFTFEGLGGYIANADKITGKPLKAEAKAYVADKLAALQQELYKDFVTTDQLAKADDARALATENGKTMAEKAHKLGVELVEYITKDEALQPSVFTDVKEGAYYRDQVTAIRKQLGDTYEVDTVHKFQGREQDAIILTSVDNVITDFVDDPHMLNVAVSRTVHSLAVITSQDPRNDQTNYGDLARYIEYNNFKIIQSQIYSVFDMLYRGYAEQRREYLQNHKRVSEYDSENLMHSVIQEILSDEPFSSIGCAVHFSLATLVKDYAPLTEEERKYARNPLTHVDFLLFNQMDKQPVLAIEVDGGSHKSGSKQAERDAKKNSILDKCAIPLLRLRTDGSGEKEKIRNALKRE